MFDLVAPLYHLGVARWFFVMGRAANARKKIEMGLFIIEEVGWLKMDDVPETP